MGVKGKINFLMSQFKGYKTNRKIIVIESDDWGSERIPSKRVQENLEQSGIDMSKNPFTKFDTLERIEDIVALNDAFDTIFNEFGKAPKITANFILANPDYDKIRDQNWNDYYFEHFTTTYKNRDGNEDVIKAINELSDKKYFRPQFHGREHLNTSLWMEELRSGNLPFKKAFDLNCFGIDAPTVGRHRANLMGAYEYESARQKEIIVSGIGEGVKMFKEQFGFLPATAVAPRHVWDDSIEEAYQKNNISCIQSSLNQLLPVESGYRHITHFTGKRNASTKMLYLVRNAFFEPSYDANYDWVGQTMKKIEMSFMLKNPAILSMHRLNFVGGLNEENRKKNLSLLTDLLVKILKKYPQAEFLSSDELSQLIEKKDVRN